MRALFAVLTGPHGLKIGNGPCRSEFWTSIARELELYERNYVINVPFVHI